MPHDPDILGASARPLFFKVADGATTLAPPPLRAGRNDAVRVAVRSLSVMQKEALVSSARTAAAWRLASDEGAYLHGHDAAPCPLSFFAVGMISSFMNEIRALAARSGVELRELTLEQDNYYTMKGSALRGSMTGGAKDVDLAVIATSEAPAEDVRALVAEAIASAPVTALMAANNESLFALSHNGAEIGPARAKRLPRAAEPDPATRFDEAAVTAGDWSRHIRRAGMSPKTDNTSTFAGGSLAEEQDRLLHVHAICSLRDDGVKQIEQHLYNPHGSIFHFLSDEAPENGGRGAAPDAASFLAAGVGFCFMTQLGRYAKIARRPLRAYRIVQDMHLALSGATGGRATAGSIDPIETHVYLESDEDEAYAQTCLDMSEQTCFLHALCRTAIKPRVRVTVNQPGASRRGQVSAEFGAGTAK